MSIYDNSHRLENKLLRFALIDSYGSENYQPKILEIANFAKESLKRHKGNENKHGTVTNNVIRDYTSASGPQSFGRHFLTQLCLDTMPVVKRTHEIGLMKEKREYYKPVIDDIKREYAKEYEEAKEELKSIIDLVQSRIRKENLNQVTLYRLLTNHEVNNLKGSFKKDEEENDNEDIEWSTNLLTSYSDVGNGGYTASTWSEIVIKRDVPVEQIVYHPKYLAIEGFLEEREIIVYNPVEKVILNQSENLHMFFKKQ